MAGRKTRGGKGARFSYTAGEHGTKVRVYERVRGGVIQIACRDPSLKGGWRRESLEHRDQDEAKRHAEEVAGKLASEGGRGFPPRRPTVGRVLALYMKHRSPDKGAGSQQEDGRQRTLWTRVLGPGFDLRKLSRREWDPFQRDRESGAIDARGNPVAEAEKRRAVSVRVVQKDLLSLRAVCHWACEFRDDAGRLLLESDPTVGFVVPKEKNPARPVATHDRVDAIRKHYRTPRMRIERGRKREWVESYLPELFELAVGSGRRISAICSLRAGDVELEPTRQAPWGAIVWPEDTDKMRKRWRCPLGPVVRKAVESALRKRNAIGPGYLFPSPGDPNKPVRYEEVSAWLRKAEKHAGLEPQRHGLWHPYRRLWASSRKDLPDVDVAQAGGWGSLEALKLAYQQPDDATMLKVVTHGVELREVR